MPQVKSLMFFLFFSGLILSSLSGQNNGHHISITLDNFENDSLFLAYYLGSNQYIKDTAVKEGGSYIFKGSEALPAGVYLIVMPPDNNFFQVLINDKEQKFSLHTDASLINEKMRVNGSTDNKLFYDYLAYLNTNRPKAEQIRAAMENETSVPRKADLQVQLNKINDGVNMEQNKIINDHPGSISAMIIKASKGLDIPEFEGTPEEVQQKQYQWYKDHYFDHINLSDERMIRTPFVNERVDYYIKKLTYQTPDSINKSLDFILEGLTPGTEGFQYYLVQFLNEYAASKVVGMDAVYVHLVDKYYSKDLAPWVEKEQLDKIVKNANTLRPILIGKKAPDLTFYKQDGSPLKISEVAAEYTVLFFWDPDCGHCKKSIPKIVDFYNEYKPKGVEILSVCTKLKDEEKQCWETIEEKGMGLWLNVSDKFLRSRYKQVYDLRTTPQIFVLDKDKKIVFKRIGAEQLPEVINHLMSEPQKS